MQIFEQHEPSPEQNSAAQNFLTALNVLEATYALEIQKQELQIASLQKPAEEIRSMAQPDFTVRRAA